jgi:hypothetical protein
LIDQDIQATVCLQRRFDGAPRSLQRGDIVRERDRLTAVRTDFLGNFPCRARSVRITPNITHNDFGSLLRHQQRLATSDASAAAGDDRHLTC